MGNQFPPFQTTDGEVDVPKLVDLSKYYEGVGIQARAQMMTAVNWLLTFAIGLLVYSVRETLELRTVWVVCTKSSEQGIVVAVVGVALSILSYATINHFEAHVYRNWLRATRCKYLVPDLFL